MVQKRDRKEGSTRVWKLKKLPPVVKDSRDRYQPARSKVILPAALWMPWAPRENNAVVPKRQSTAPGEAKPLERMTKFPFQRVTSAMLGCFTGGCIRANEAWKHLKVQCYPELNRNVGRTDITEPTHNLF